MVKPETVGMSAERLGRIRSAVQKHVGPNKIAGAVTLVARCGHIVHLDCTGYADRENGQPMQPDTLFRIWSMTKPIVCVALMTLYEQGCFQLADPVAKLIPAFRDLPVYAGEDEAGIKLEKLARDVTIRDLLTHTSGISYPFFEYGPVEQLAREKSFAGSDKPLAEFVADLLTVPLAFQPGTSWRYGLSHDVVAYLVELISGAPLDVYLRDVLFEPLGMTDTGFYVPPEKQERFSCEYGSADLLSPGLRFSRWNEDAANGANLRLCGPADSIQSRPERVFRGGHGLVSTATDYYRFCQMLLNRGELDGRRILSRKTVELMTTNQLDASLLPYEIAGNYFAGYGYGLGMRVLMDLGQCGTLGSAGEYGWAGAANTYFWVDPEEDMIGILMTQFQPDGTYPISPDFRVAAYQAIND